MTGNSPPNFDTPPFIIPAGGELTYSQYGSMVTNLDSDGNLSIRMDGGNKTRFNKGDKYELPPGDRFRNLTIINETGAAVTVTVGVGIGNISVSNAVNVTNTVSVQQIGGAGLNHNRVAVDNTADLILAANSSRLSWSIYNGGAETVYIGDTNAVTTTTGYPLVPGAHLSGNGRHDIYGITAAGSVNVQYLEEVI